jgi:nitroreductase
LVVSKRNTNFVFKINYTNMDNFKELCKNRRSIRRFTDEELTQEQVETLLKTALMVPSGKSVRGWEFIVVDDKNILTQLAHSKDHGAELVEGAPLAVVVAYDSTKSDVWVEDASAATTYLLLSAADMGLGACWVQIRNRMAADGTLAEENCREILGLPSEMRVLSIVAVGHKDQERKPIDEEKLLWEHVHINQYQKKD